MKCERHGWTGTDRVWDLGSGVWAERGEKAPSSRGRLKHPDRCRLVHGLRVGTTRAPFAFLHPLKSTKSQRNSMEYKDFGPKNKKINFYETRSEPPSR